MNAQAGPDEAPQTPKASSDPAAPDSSQPEQPAPPPAAGLIQAEQPAEERGKDGAPPPHAQLGLIQSRRDFFIQTAVVAIGVLLALGLEQSVEAVHHARQRAQLEEQMHEMLEANAPLIADHLTVAADFRAHLVELQRAVVARRHGRATPTAPLASDPRIHPSRAMPILGVYQAAKATGAVTLLSLNRVRLYDRLAFQYDGVAGNRVNYNRTHAALRAFRQRFEPTEEMTLVLPVDLALLSSAELVEYQALIGDALDANGQFIASMTRFDRMSRAILGGVQNEEELFQLLRGPVDAATRDQP